MPKMPKFKDEDDEEDDSIKIKTLRTQYLSSVC
jgi:hypothetical protein